MSNDRLQQLILWLEKKRYPLQGSLTTTQYTYRMAYNKAIEEVLALLHYDGEYRESTINEILERLGIAGA